MLGNEKTRPRVLVVEDDEAIVRMLQMSLRSGGFAPEKAGSGQEAIDALDASDFDAVVLDLCLPDGRGADVLAKLQTNGRLPVWIVMSALDEYEAIRRFGPLKGPFLAKPFDPWDLTRLLDRLLMLGRGNGERQLGAAAS
jgi:DNA-binding response OmpR family regulator